MTDNRGHQIPAALRGAGRGIRTSLRSHPLTAWLAVLVASVTALAVVLGTIRIQGADSGAASGQQSQQLARLASAVTLVAQSMEDEQSAMATYIGQGRPVGQIALLFVQGQESVTNLTISQLASLARRSDSDLTPRQHLALNVALGPLRERLSLLRRDAVSSRAPALSIIEDYWATISDLLVFDAQIASGLNDPVFIRDVYTWSALQRAEDAGALQRAIVGAALAAGQWQDGEEQALSAAHAQEQAELADFNSQATVAQQQLYNKLVSGSYVDNANEMLQQELNSGPYGGLTVAVPPGSPFRTAQQAWNEDTGFTLDQMRMVEQRLLAAIPARDQALHAQAATTVVETWFEMAGAILIVVACAVGLTWRRSRSSRARGFHPAAGEE
jgi:hypothetical protein